MKERADRAQKEMVAVAVQKYARMRKAQRELRGQLTAKDGIVRLQAMWRGAQARDEVQLAMVGEMSASSVGPDAAAAASCGVVVMVMMVAC